MNDHFKHKPIGTLWIGSEIFVSFDCESKPIIEELVITGIKQFGFVFSHEYEIKAYVEDSRKKKCKKDKCDHALSYEFDVRFNVYEKIGIGFGLGAGTGTFGWTTPSTNYVEQFTSRCICCDNDDFHQERSQIVKERWVVPASLIQRTETGLAAVAAFSILGFAIVTSFVYPEHTISKSFLSFVGLSTTIAFILSIFRFSKSKSRKNHKKIEHHH